VRKYFKTTLFVTVIVSIVAVLAIQRTLERLKAAGPPPTVVRIEQVKKGRLKEFVTAPGQIEPKTQVEISAKVSARVIELPYDEGDAVTVGDPNADPPIPPSVLVKLDSKDLVSRLESAVARYEAQKAQLEVAKASLAAARARLEGTKGSMEQAQKEFERQKLLFESHDISQSAFDTAQQNYLNLKAQYQAALYQLQADEIGLQVAEYNLRAQKATVDEAREAVGYCVITAPMDGVITRINVEVGTVVTGTISYPGTIIMTVADLSKMLVVAEVDEADIGKLRVGQKADVRVQAYYGQSFHGVVDQIAVAHSVSRTGAKFFRTEILLQGDVSRLYSGLTADVDIYTDEHVDVITVPAQAVLSRKVDDLPFEIRDGNPNIDPDKTDCMVVYRVVDGKTVVTPVTIGPSDMTRIIIESGLNVGDQVIVGPYKVLDTMGHDRPVIDEREAAAKKKQQAEAKQKGAADGGKAGKSDAAKSTGPTKPK